MHPMKNFLSLSKGRGSKNIPSQIWLMFILDGEIGMLSNSFASSHEISFKKLIAMIAMIAARKEVFTTKQMEIKLNNL